MRRKILTRLTALLLLMCFLPGSPLIIHCDEPLEGYQVSADIMTYQAPDGLHIMQHHHPVKARCLEKSEVIHTPIRLIHEPTSFVPFLHRKQSTITLQHSRPPDYASAYIEGKHHED